MDTNENKVEAITSMNKETHFEILTPLPVPLSCIQCVVHNHEIVICGGYKNKECYSYHTIKNEYNKITNAITLLSFGGQGNFEKKCTLIMKYVSVWDDNYGKENKVSNINKTEKFNEWIQFTDNHNNPIYIGKFEEDYNGIRAIISGNAKNLLFITYPPRNINVFDLNTFQFVKQDVLPIDNEPLGYHCFVPKTENLNKNVSEMFLFCRNAGLSIGYDEHNNIFQYRNVWVCTTLKSLFSYGYAYVNDSILFFSGRDVHTRCASKEIHKYSVIENTWTKFEQTLDVPLTDCNVIVSEDNAFVHIVGGYDEEEAVSTHMKMRLKRWLEGKTKTEIQWTIEEEEKKDIEESKRDSEGIKKQFTIKKLKKKRDTEMIIEHWIRSLSLKMGWIDDFNIIRKYFKFLKLLQGHFKKVNSVAFSPDGTNIASASYDGTVQVWDISSDNAIQILKGHTTCVNDAQFSPDGNTIVSCSEDATIRLWNVKTGKEIKVLEGHSGDVIRVRFSPDGNTIVSSSDDHTMRLWDSQSGKEIKVLECSVNDVQFSPDGQQIVSASNDQKIRIWNVKSGEISKTLEYSDSVITIQFSRDGCLFVSTSINGTIQIWDAISYSQLKKMFVHSAVISDVKFFPDGQIIVSCAWDGSIQLWDVKFGMELQRLQRNVLPVTRVGVSPDGNKIVASSHDKTIQLWEPL
ncbi:G-protein beta WD-40 repeats containing protein [Reticulomyxa filosa]|uniref:G-protein beta WD-40 repeats containing protein n=1 Tax=Reticulomyxa filosa TaxID=46433 RepID=X6NYD6_RETFI|nr:G-protein beta WD-40 repeats containing protein [Reticulomyxa filosa]|eukprot:ETO30991.1 G-protein beta WD-40 repeats containing protein [Reticulomyxa filosa]